MMALREVEQEEVQETQVSPRRRVDIATLPRPRGHGQCIHGLNALRRPATVARLDRPTPLEEGLASTARLIKALDQTLIRCKDELGRAYAESGRIRKDSGQQAALAKVQQDIARLEATLANNQLQVKEDISIKLDPPRIRNLMPREERRPLRRKIIPMASASRHAQVLDNEIHNLLREPREGQLSRLADLLASTETSPTLKTFNIIISRLSRLRLNAAAWIMFRAALRLGYTPDEYTLSSIMNLCIVSNNYRAFTRLLLAARAQRKLERDARGPGRHGRGLVLMSTIIKGCVKFQRMRRAGIYYRLMWSERQKPNLEIMTVMVQGYTDRKDWRAGVQILKRLLLRDRWDRKSVVAMIHLCRVCRQTAVEGKIRDLAPSKGVQLESGGDYAVLPPNFKTKGLDLPNRQKRPVKNDVGALSPETLARRAVWKKRWRSDRPVMASRREAFGKWA